MDGSSAPTPPEAPPDPRDILAPREAERLLDAMARILLAAARVRAAGRAAESDRASRSEGTP